MTHKQLQRLSSTNAFNKIVNIDIASLFLLTMRHATSKPIQPFGIEFQQVTIHQAME